MAHDTPLDVRSLVFYQVFVRNHSEHGRLADVTADLPRIAALGVDVVYLTPIHPIGVEGRKGALGSPYAIRDYRALNPELGTDEDFDALVAAAHALGLRVMLDVVFNHTARDSVLVGEHPEFFHQDAHGNPVTTVPAWTDVIDLDHTRPGVADYLVESLAVWVRRGVDGFRCDVASLVPVDFWVRARAELAALRPGLLWLAETPHASWVAHRRATGSPTWSDAEMFAAFDIEYPSDLWSIWQAVVSGQEPVGRYLEMLRWQDATFPANYAKLRFVENHDQFRIMRFAPTEDVALAWTALMAFSRGPLLIYAGQETAAVTWPTLFERAPVDWTRPARLTGFLRALAELKKHPALALGEPWILADEPVVQLAWAHLSGEHLVPAGGSALLGLFDVGAPGRHEGVDTVRDEELPGVGVVLPDGQYQDLISGGTVAVVDGRALLPGSAAVLEFHGPIPARLWRSTLLDVFLSVEELGD